MLAFSRYTVPIQGRDEAMNATVAEALMIDDIHFIAYGIVAPLIVCGGVIGNLLTILILSLPQFKGVTYTYFVVMAAMDLVSLLFCISIFVHIIEGATPVYSEAVWYSHFEIYCANVPFTTSAFIAVCVTVDRFYSICRPIKFSAIHNETFARRAIAVAFALSALIWLPICFLKRPEEHSDCHSSRFFSPGNDTWWVACMVNNTLDAPWYMVYSWIRQTIISFLPIFLLVTLNTLTLRRLTVIGNKRKEMRRKSVLFGPQTLTTDWNLIHLLSAVMISFTLTMIPAGVFNAIYTEFLSSSYEYEIFRAIANILEILNHALNFYFYMLCSKSVRQAAITVCHEIRSTTTNWIFLIGRTSIQKISECGHTFWHILSYPKMKEESKTENSKTASPQDLTHNDCHEDISPSANRESPQILEETRAGDAKMCQDDTIAEDGNLQSKTVLSITENDSKIISTIALQTEEITNDTSNNVNLHETKNLVALLMRNHGKPILLFPEFSLKYSEKLEISVNETAA